MSKKLEAAKIAKQAMEKGYNCCESVLMAMNSVWNLSLSQDTFASALYFKEGMGSGCTCGALVGMVMASAIMRDRFNQPVDKDLPNRLYKRFQQEFKSTCCRVIRKNRSILERISNNGCIELTAKATAMLVEEWEDRLGQVNQKL